MLWSFNKFFFNLLIWSEKAINFTITVWQVLELLYEGVVMQVSGCLWNWILYSGTWCFDHKYCIYSCTCKHAYQCTYTEWKTPDNGFRSYSRIVGPLHWTCFMSCFWCLEFGSALRLLWRICVLLVVTHTSFSLTLSSPIQMVLVMVVNWRYVSLKLSLYKTIIPCRLSTKAH